MTQKKQTEKENKQNNKINTKKVNFQSQRNDWLRVEKRFDYTILAVGADQLCGFTEAVKNVRELDEKRTK